VYRARAKIRIGGDGEDGTHHKKHGKGDKCCATFLENQRGANARARHANASTHSTPPSKKKIEKKSEMEGGLKQLEITLQYLILIVAACGITVSSVSS
jgi:hypothetical protein